MKRFTEFLNETTLSRVTSHFKSARPVAILTAFRGSNTYEDNVKLNKQLASSIKSAGYGYVYVDGHWVEKDGNNIDDTSEDSILIIGNEVDDGKLKGLVTKWMKKYDQDGVLFKAEGEGQEMTILYSDGRVETIGKFSPNKIAQAYTKLRGRGKRSFVFEGYRETPNWIGQMSRNVTN